MVLYWSNEISLTASQTITVPTIKRNVYKVISPIVYDLNKSLEFLLFRRFLFMKNRNQAVGISLYYLVSLAS